MRGSFTAPHHHDPNEMLLNFAFWVMVAALGKASMQQNWLVKNGLDVWTQQPHKNKAAVELSQSMRLGLMSSDTAGVTKEMPEGAESADE